MSDNVVGRMGRTGVLFLGLSSILLGFLLKSLIPVLIFTSIFGILFLLASLFINSAEESKDD